MASKKYKSLIKDNTSVTIKKLGITLRGGFFTPQKVLKQIHDAGLTSIVEEVKEKKEKSSAKNTKKTETNENKDSDN